MAHRGIWIAASLSVILHVVVGAVYSLGPRAAPSRVKPSLHVRMLEAPPPPATSKPQSQQPAPPPVTSTNSTASAEPPQSPEKQAPAPDAATERPDPPLFSRAVRYLSSEEVDVPASPLYDWVLHSEEIPPSRQVTLKLALFINEDGWLDQYDVLEASLPLAATQSLLRDLAQTRFSRALKDGQPVSSKREVEITIDNRALPFGPRNPPTSAP